MKSVCQHIVNVAKQHGGGEFGLEKGLEQFWNLMAFKFDGLPDSALPRVASIENDMISVRKSMPEAAEQFPSCILQLFFTFFFFDNFFVFLDKSAKVFEYKRYFRLYCKVNLNYFHAQVPHPFLVWLGNQENNNRNKPVRELMEFLQTEAGVKWQASACSSGYGVYPVSALINHDCRPTVEAVWVEGKKFNSTYHQSHVFTFFF
jgi:hypothetical protein